ncbi:hypothetical protein [Chloroflexus sp.]|uniref:hypothetical protein n=1 Tax=Chloroflexus sp. TaxID=1904827 RepID=UPI00404A1B3B
MHIALYVGQNPQRTALLAFAAPIVAACAHRVTLITPVSGQNDLDEVVNQLHINTAIPVQHRCQETTFAAAILSAVQTERPDLLIAPAFSTSFHSRATARIQSARSSTSIISARAGTCIRFPHSADRCCQCRG